MKMKEQKEQKEQGSGSDGQSQDIGLEISLMGYLSDLGAAPKGTLGL